jgi:predicted O-methyltransferase YrrM
MILNKVINLSSYLFIRSWIARYREIDGWLTRIEALGLFQCASKLSDNSVVVEIGTWKGKSTYCIAKGLSSGKIYSVDPFDGSAEQESASEYAKKRGEIPLQKQFEDKMIELDVINKITPMKGFSKDFVGKFPQIDFLFIDGDHSIEGCEFDFVNYSPYLKIGGYIAFHDYYKDRDSLGPTWVVKNKVLKSSGFQFYKLYDSLWVGRRIS